MKGKLFIAGLALLALAACNKEDKINDPASDAKGYISVKLSMSGNDTKALAGFQVAGPEEVKVNKAVFLFLDENGNQCADAFESSAFDWTGTTDHPESDDKASKAVIVIKNAEKLPSQLLCIINGPSKNELTGNLEAILKITNDYSSTTNGFVMSNSVYASGSKAVVATPIEASNIAKTEKDALANPVKVHVERVLARVEVTMPELKAQKFTVNETADTEITSEYKGFWLDNTNPKSYLVKNLNTSFEGTWWNDQANVRSYWATSVAADALTHYAFNTAKTDPQYVQENTPKVVNFEVADKSYITKEATQFVVAVQHKVGGEAKTLVKYLSNLYTQEGFEALISKRYFDADSKPATLTFTYATNTDAKAVANPDPSGAKVYADNDNIEDWEAVVTVTATGDVYNAGGVKTDLPEPIKVQYWKDGQAYYYLPIVHNDTLTKEEITDETTDEAGVVTPAKVETPAAEGYYGIVRNHLYKVNVTSMTGLGTPVSNVEKTITPEKPVDANSYIAAEIIILKYKVVDHDYELK